MRLFIYWFLGNDHSMVLEEGRACVQVHQRYGSESLSCVGGVFVLYLVTSSHGSGHFSKTSLYTSSCLCWKVLLIWLGFLSFQVAFLLPASLCAELKYLNQSFRVFKMLVAFVLFLTPLPEKPLPVVTSSNSQSNIIHVSLTKYFFSISICYECVPVDLVVDL